MQSDYQGVQLKDQFLGKDSGFVTLGDLKIEMRTEASY